MLFRKFNYSTEPGIRHMSDKRKIYPHTLAGIALITVAEVLLFRGNRFVGKFFTPLIWTGYIILIDGIIASITKSSPLVTRRKEFFISLPLSIVSWYVFEGVNLLLKNWSYVNLPESTIERWIGYVWSYATIFPAIFLTAELIDIFLRKKLNGKKGFQLSETSLKTFFFAGFLLFVLTLVYPSPYLCPLPWISVLLWFEGMNSHLNFGSFSDEFKKGNYSFFVSLLISGIVAGFLWEFWNYWAITKWNYHVPYLPNVKIFEMPVLGYLGFPPFALECYLMYRFARACVPIKCRVDVLGKTCEKVG